MMDRKAFRALSSGLYLITSHIGERKVGCVVNTFLQVASEPPTVTVALNKENATTEAVRETGRYAATVLSQDAPLELIGTFGFHTSADTDKFATCDYAIDEADIPYVKAHGLARFSVRVTETIDVGTHYLFVGVVEESEVLAEGEPLTYAYYHAVKGGKTPPKAASYNPEGDPEGSTAAAPAPASADASADEAPAAGKRVAWRCMICGYVEEGYPDGLPEDYSCPICGAPRDMFERIEL